jgi:formate dehydrogenase subunit delta
MSNDDKLIYMANQIAKYFAAQGEARAIAGIADHLQRFWDPEMRRTLLALADRDSSGLLPAVKLALPMLKPEKSRPGAS